MFPLLILELFSEIVSVAGIPDGGTEPDFLVLYFLPRTFLPSSSPMLLSIRDNIQRHTVISHRAASLPHLPQPALCTRGHQKIGEAVYSLLYSVAHRSLETQI